MLTVFFALNIFFFFVFQKSSHMPLRRPIPTGRMPSRWSQHHHHWHWRFHVYPKMQRPRCMPYRRLPRHRCHPNLCPSRFPRRQVLCFDLQPSPKLHCLFPRRTHGVPRHLWNWCLHLLLLKNLFIWIFFSRNNWSLCHYFVGNS